jgi:NADH-quinone oxidoreductase subunit E
MAGHAIGVWFGAMSGAAVASQRVFLQFAEAEAPDVGAFRDALRTPALRAQETAAALIAEVEAGTEKTGSAKVRRLTPRAKVARPEAKTTEPEAEAKPASESATTDDAATASPPTDAAAPSAEPVAPVEPAVEAVAPVEVAAEATDAESAPAVAEQAAVIAADPVETAAAPRKPAEIDRPEQPDDLKAISGIGPKLEHVLNGFGIWTYAQIAGLDGAETAWLDDALGFRGRIGRDDWIGQAAKLSRGEG